MGWILDSSARVDVVVIVNIGTSGLTNGTELELGYSISINTVSSPEVPTCAIDRMTYSNGWSNG